jgi:predicted DNA-binding mobile mystery protein A
VTINKTIQKQYLDKVDQAFKLFSTFVLPAEGWLKTVRKALGMTGSQLAKRLKVTKARISRAEHDEPLGQVTLKSMQAMAEAMGCRFVYAIVPDKPVEQILKQRALVKAREKVKAASVQMALEGQALDEEQLAYEIERVAVEMVAERPADLWGDV